MRVLLTNDDGIEADGLRKLAEITAKVAEEVYIVAPDGNRSAISHGISIQKNIQVKQVEFPFVTAAYSCSGTPADCVKVAINAILEMRPDFVISGMNHGYNMGYDTVYSGTVAAAKESVYQGVPSAAISVGSPDFSSADRYLEQVLRYIFSQEILRHEIWNINFPAIAGEECRGIRFGTPASFSYYKDTYSRTRIAEGIWDCMLTDEVTEIHEENSDFNAVRDGYISVGTLECEPLKEIKQVRFTDPDPVA
ncbi:MAG: 5'/3'-nucleotidase SurE [Lachnospiraceae bacterium]